MDTLKRSTPFFLVGGVCRFHAGGGGGGGAASPPPAHTPAEQNRLPERVSTPTLPPLCSQAPTNTNCSHPTVIRTDALVRLFIRLSPRCPSSFGDIKKKNTNSTPIIVKRCEQMAANLLGSRRGHVKAAFFSPGLFWRRYFIPALRSYLSSAG